MTRLRAKRSGSHALSTLAPDEMKSVVDQFKRPAGSSEPATNNSGRARPLRPDIEGSPISGEGECIRPITESGLFQQPLTLRPPTTRWEFHGITARATAVSCRDANIRLRAGSRFPPGATRPHRVSARRLRRRNRSHRRKRRVKTGDARFRQRLRCARRPPASKSPDRRRMQKKRAGPSRPSPCNHSSRRFPHRT